MRWLAEIYRLTRTFDRRPQQGHLTQAAGNTLLSQPAVTGTKALKRSEECRCLSEPRESAADQGWATVVAEAEDGSLPVLAACSNQARVCREI